MANISELEKELKLKKQYAKALRKENIKLSISAVLLSIVCKILSI